MLIYNTLISEVRQEEPEEERSGSGGHQLGGGQEHGSDGASRGYADGDIIKVSYII